MHEVDPETIGQCTGLKDKNKTLAFEGDIVKTKIEHYTDIVNLVVAWHVDRLMLIDGKKRFHGLVWLAFSEIIGNVHENPELLEESK